MIANRDRTTVLSSIGWVDGDAIWVCDVASGNARTIPQNTGAKYTSLHASDSERFIAVHHFDGARFLASVSLFSAPEMVTIDQRLKIRKSAKLGRQPHEAIELPNGDVIARDWKTGDLLRGRLEPVSWLKALFP